jgi:hypothetical protein
LGVEGSHLRGLEMRDLRNELYERMKLLEHKIKAEDARYQRLVEKFKAERDGKVANLKAQLDAIDKLSELSAWQESARATLTVAIAAAEAVMKSQVGKEPVPLLPEQKI